jgi:hypothetical protein
MKAILLTVRILSVTLYIRCLLSFTKLPRLLEIIESKQNHQRKSEAEIQTMIAQIDQIARFRYFLIRNNCLKKSLVFYYFLLRAGVKDVQINMGISKVDAKLDGHCWLTHNGSVFMDTEEFVSTYKVIYSSGVTSC